MRLSNRNGLGPGGHRRLNVNLLAGAAAVAMLASAGAAFAQSADQIEEVVVTAPNYVPSTTTGSKTATSIIETPQSVTVINRDLIDVQHWTSLQQVVRYSAGVNGENYGPDARYDWLTLRGFYPIQYIDGLQAPIGSVTNVGTDLYGFESVEILKGPSSGLYGSTPPGGIVNMTSRRPKDLFGGELGGEVGSNDLWEVHGDVTGPITDNLSYRLTGLYRDSGSQIDFEKDRRGYIAPALTWNIAPSTTLTLLGYYQNDNIRDNGGGFLPAYGVVLPSPHGRIPRNRNLGEPGYNTYQRDQYAVGYEFSHAFNDKLSFVQNLKYFKADTKTLSVYGAGLVDPTSSIVNRSNFPFNEKVASLNIDNRLQAKFDTGVLDHTVLLGLDYRHYTINSVFGFSSAPPIDVFNPVYGQPIVTPSLYPYQHAEQDQTGLYLQDQIRHGGWVLTVGGRQDWVSTNDKAASLKSDDSKFTWRAGLNYVFSNGIAPYFSYATSFQPTTGSSWTGTPFKPTSGDQYEVGVKVEPKWLPSGFKTLITLAAFDLTQSNVLTPDPDPTHLYAKVQAGEVEVKGVELEGVARIYERISLNASYSYTDSDVTKSNDLDLGKQLPMVPTHKAALFGDYTFQGGFLAGFGGGLGMRYTSSSYGDNYNDWRNKSVVLWDVVLHYDFRDWRMTLNASNLFDKTYVAQCSSYADCYYGTARNVTFSVTRKF